MNCLGSDASRRAGTGAQACQHAEQIVRTLECSVPKYTAAAGVQSTAPSTQHEDCRAHRDDMLTAGRLTGVSTTVMRSLRCDEVAILAQVLSSRALPQLPETDYRLQAFLLDSQYEITGRTTRLCSVPHLNASHRFRNSAAAKRKLIGKQPLKGNYKSKAYSCAVPRMHDFLRFRNLQIKSP